MLALTAAAPVLLVCVALALRASAGRAAGLGIGVALALTPIAFPLPAAQPLGRFVAWVPTLVAVLVIVAGGIGLSRLIDHSGAQATMARALESRVMSPLFAALLVVHGVVPFAESVTGFGVGVMVGVPLLLHLGFGPARSAFLGLLGLVAVPWGALAPGTLIAARLIDADLTDVGVASAQVNLVPCLVTGVTAALAAGAGPRPLRVTAGLVSGGVLWGAILGANLVVGTPLAGVVGSLFVIAAHLVGSRLRGGRGPTSAGAPPSSDEVSSRTMSLRRAVVPYTFLVVGLLVSDLAARAVGPSPWTTFLSSPATWLVLTCALAVVVFRIDRSHLRPLGARVWRMWLAVGLPTGMFLALGVIMAATGMSEELAGAAARLGPVYLALVPVVGAVGGFVTGSNAGANSMFGAAQAHAGATLGASPVVVVATQNVAAAMLTMASPSRIEMASQFVDTPQERFDRRRLMGRMLGVCAIAVSLLCLLTWATA